MFRSQDPYSYTQFLPLYRGKSQIGFALLDYRVMLYNDVQVLNAQSVDQSQNQQFIVNCTQRIMLRNPSFYSVSPIKNPAEVDESFENYPVLFTATIELDNANAIQAELLDYSPFTVNTAVQQTTSAGDSTGTSSGTATTNTTGTSMSQSSTYGVSVGVEAGFMGDIPTGSVSRTTTHEHSTSKGSEQSTSNARDTSASAGSESGRSTGMSIKDWGSYAAVNLVSRHPVWVFGQEYPWNAIECRFAPDPVVPNPLNNDQVKMTVSSSMQNALFDGDFLYPPSELSMYGLNFVMKSTWRVFIPYDMSTNLTVVNDIQYYSGAHALSSDGKGGYEVNVYMDQTPTPLHVSDNAADQPSITFDLNIMALDPIGVNGNVAVVGFIPSKLIPPPPSGSDTVPAGFKTLAATNDLMVSDTTDYTGDQTTGFSASQTCLTANWSSEQNFPYSLTLYFKVIDSVTEYTLYIKHWKTQTTGVELSININNTYTMVKYVDALEAEGGEDNLLKVALRNLDFASVDYHDYLQLGLNAVEITMQPTDQMWADCGYQIRAVSVVKNSG